MTVASERQRRVAASFTRQYYTLMVQQPEKLSAFYTPHATFDHLGHKAEGTAEIETTIAALYPVQPNGSAQIHSLTVETTPNGHIHLAIKGSITTALNVTYNFTHDVELIEHETQPGSFGIVNDKRERTIKEEALQRWALETPPMFAQEAKKDAMEPIEQPAATTAVKALEKSPAKKSVEPPKKGESPASEKVAAVNSTVPERSVTVSPDSCANPSATDATVEKVAVKKLEEEGTATTTTTMPSTSAANTEVKKPKSFAEAILMGKRTGGAQGHAAPLKVVAKGGKEQSTEEPVKEKKEKNRESAAVAEKNGTKGAHRNGTSGKKPTAVTASAEGEKKNGKPSAEGGNHKEGFSNSNNNTTTNKNNNTNHNNNTSNNNNNNNNRNNKKKDADGRTLSRFVVFYDIIVKGLPHDATEETVREIIGTTAPVKLVNVLSQPDKKDPAVLRTFAFVQLDHDAIKEAGDDVKATVTKIVSSHKGKKGPNGQRYQIDEVREKYTAAPAEASA
ncbi:mucin-associated surface protein (MASP) [Trypanosoma theileri]|uniref:Mucin-associated surface protein (MASP) n=1 Tax=Trypanosoma theileri TaxID=67003 RepID=A0A1X0P6X4_9TRYP|nr:mucin-associated surface protein (MASP) [Trypanosoma theileri]ORC92618.1 mucin-associated surface protein (MASP) [Trypanosoma theileri]